MSRTELERFTLKLDIVTPQTKTPLSGWETITETLDCIKSPVYFVR